MTLGIDEVGRGPWAGPLVVGAVLWPKEVTLEGLTDSKKLSPKKRELYSQKIVELALDYSLGEVSASELDEMGLSNALRLATKRAVDGIKKPYRDIIIDGTINFLNGTIYSEKVSTLKKADLLVPAVSAASILAKVKRDQFMKDLAVTYPGYDFENNVGYGTKKHREAIDLYGVTPQHRLSFKPLSKYRAADAENLATSPLPTTSKQLGDEAESVVAQHLLEGRGHRVLVRNYKTKYCEVDIISIKDKTIYFTEVKYRQNEDFGGARDAISLSKQKQMAYAANIFMNSNRVRSKDISRYTTVLAAGLVGADFKLLDWIVLD